MLISLVIVEQSGPGRNEITQPGREIRWAGASQNAGD